MFTNSQPAEKDHLDIQNLLQPGLICGGNNPTMHVEERIKLLHHPTKHLWPFILPGHHLFSVLDYRIHHNIEDGGRHQVSLCDSPGSLERESLVSPALDTMVIPSQCMQMRSSVRRLNP